MVFEKNGCRVSLVDGMSDEGEIWLVETEPNLIHLPDSLLLPVRKSDTKGLAKLRNSLVAWAESKGYLLVAEGL